ncbi:ATP-binding protein [Actinokineospora enzanensis]|uniref:ATP-binding protein n=1 Tax=Actinokineospora enzanensis TaxID=155975 RepID=UPI00037B8FE0|nr:ATP-binding protein [Actinokineospora enzanensis]
MIDESVLAEARRLAAVHGVERALPGRSVPADWIAWLATRALGAPMAVLTLVRTTSVHFAGRSGLPPEFSASRDMPLTGSFCPVVVSTNRPVAIDDARADPDYRGFDAVRSGVLRAYLGVPLRDGHGRAVGALAVADGLPRRWSDDDMVTLLRLCEFASPRQEKPIGTGGPDEAVLVVNSHGDIAECNTTAAEMFGWSTAELRGRPMNTLIPTQAWERARDSTGRAARSRVTAHHSDGHPVPVELSISDRETAHGHQWSVLVLDAAERAAAERLASRQDSFLHTVLDNLHAPVAACDAEGNVVLLNQALRQSMGLAGGGISSNIDQVDSVLFHGDGAPMSGRDTPLARALAGAVVRDADLVVKLPGAPVRAFLADATAIHDDGRVTGAVAVLHDVTRQRRFERFRHCELQVAETLATAVSLTEAAPALAEAVAHALGWPHVRLLLVDPVTDSLHTAGQWTAPPLDASSVDEVVHEAAMTSGRPVWVADMADARTGLHTAVAMPIPGSPPVGILACFADTCETDEADFTAALRSIAAHIGQFAAQRHAAGLAAQLDSSRDDFVSLVGHQLRTPLTAVVAYTELLLDGPVDPATEPLLSVVHRNATALTTIVDDLLDLAALRSGDADLRPTTTDFATIVRDATTAHLDIDTPDHLPIEADPTRLRQLVDHLVSNAINYGARTGTIRLTRLLDTAELTVTDTGIGIPAEDRPHLFRSFFRATNVRHGAIPGAGLGLAITRAIVEAHHGTITIDHHDPGTTVTVRLPLHLPPVPGQRARPASAGY